MDTIKRFERLDSKKAKQRFLRRCSIEGLWQLSKSDYFEVLWDVLAYAPYEALRQFVNCLDNTLLLFVCNSCLFTEVRRILEVCDDDTLRYIVINCRNLAKIFNCASPWVTMRLISLVGKTVSDYKLDLFQMQCVSRCLTEANRRLENISSELVFSI